MRLGGTVCCSNPAEWEEKLAASGFRAVTAPHPMHGAVFFAIGSHRMFSSGSSGSCSFTRPL